MAGRVPDKPSLDGIEARWGARWEADGVYRFDRNAPRDRVYAIDTPPPTVSGSLHIGHAFSYTETDVMARYKRMRGFAVWYPMGWDDNGLPTERRVQNYFGVRCDPSLPYQPDFEPPVVGGLGKDDRPVAVSRPNFVELCQRLTAEDERAFEELFRFLGLSVDWSHTYATIDPFARATSQRAWLRLLARGQAYQAEAPTLWDVDFRTAVAQAELEDRERPGAYHKLAFHRVVPEGEAPADILIDTTRPELLPACVALVAHPDDERYRPLFGTTVTTPLFGVEVPVLAHPLAQPDKGTGVAMICTFGDVTDVIWWRELHLPVRAVVGRDGRLLATAPAGMPEPGAAIYTTELAGKAVGGAARNRIVELLADSGELVGDPRPITHAVKFFEKGDRPLEIVTSRQWFIRTLEHREALLARGRELTWHPAFMRARYDNWVEGLNTDWLVSRQRFFGVPFPLWYRLDDSGEPVYDPPLVPDESALPVDPTTDVPPGFTESQRDVPGGFTADPDVMDTWATSSLTPQIAGRWEDDDDLWSRLWPMDLRPQAHDIIRTWLFTTVVRAHLEFDSVPWRDLALSGWILDPDRKKMSKSKGNVVTPMPLLERYSSDAVRYWAASARLGTDTALDEGQMKIGRKLAIKLLNVSNFVLGPRGLGLANAPEPVSSVSEPLDRALLASLGQLVADATTAFESYDYARALERTEGWFWTFCDDFVELVKARAYGESGPEAARSARATLLAALSVLVRLFAPVLPYTAEEVWSWWQEGSVHVAPWPTPDDVAGPGGVGGDPALLGAAATLLSEIRRRKTEAGVSLRAPVASVTVCDTPDRLALLAQAGTDLGLAGAVSAFRWEASTGGDPSVAVELAPTGVDAAGQGLKPGRERRPPARSYSPGMPINPDAVGFASEPRESSWDSKDCLLYALGVGAGVADPTGFELELTTENTDGVTQQVLPTFPVVVAGGGGTMEALGSFDRAMLVHGRQSVELAGPVPVSGRITATTRIDGIWDKGAAAVVDTVTTATDATTGELRWTTRASMFIRGEGGWGGERGPSARTVAPERAPDETVTYPTRPDQALLYRLNGDRNPLHSDPSFAARGGFERPILHGLCTYGFTGRALLHTLCGSDPARFVSMSGRFSQPVFPGQPLTVSMWRTGPGQATFLTASDTGTVIDGGELRYLAD